MYIDKEFPEFLHDKYKSFKKEIPSMLKAQKFTDDLIYYFFPFKVDKRCTLPQIELNFAQLQIDFMNMLNPLEGKLDKSIKQLNEDFFSQIPEIYKNLMDDAQHYVEFDPAAHAIESIILYYPGFYAITIYRLAHVLYKLHIPYIPRIMSEYAHSKTGIDIHPGATIARNFLIDHGTGVVIGETAVIGDNVKIYQGVTLGALHVKKDMRGKKRHPSIEDNVIIYGGTTILGGDTVIGHDSIIGGNVWLTKSVEPFSLVYHESKMKVRDTKMRDDDVINFVI
ncbi:MAG: serine acetyltransferase [Bacteroidales bacterium]|nr:serine acetyltransferase [Bacteroidales bacterium]